jgi:hypothetical protein
MKPDDLFVPLVLEQDVAGANRGDVASALRLGYGYLTGSAGVIDLARARLNFGLAAPRSSAASAWLGYLDATLGSDPETNQRGIGRLQQAVDLGDPVGQTLMGRIYEKGRGGCRKDRQAAAALYTAASAEFALAKTFLGQMLLGRGNFRDAIRLFKDASAAGEVGSMVSLASLYLRERLKKPNIIGAKRLLRAAVARNDRVALFRLGVIYRDGIGGSAPGADHRAFNLFHRSARLGYRPACTATARCYALGSGAPRSEKAARFWWGRSAARSTGQAKLR